MRMLRDESHSTAAGKSHVITEKTKKKKKSQPFIFSLSPVGLHTTGHTMVVVYDDVLVFVLHHVFPIPLLLR